MPSRPSLPFPHAVHHARQLPQHAQRRSIAKPAAAYRQRDNGRTAGVPFSAPEIWHPPTESGEQKVVIQPAGEGYIHPVTSQEVLERIQELPARFVRELEVIQFSRMTHKRRTFPCYGMQWGRSVYLYPIEANLVELYTAPPKPAQRIEAQMFGAVWSQQGRFWSLSWTADTIRDFYLNNVLIHEIGHLNDPRNKSYRQRERFANWFAIEYGYKASRR